MDGGAVTTCDVCATPVPAGASFCPACGARQRTQADERRVVTVLFADIVGYTQLSEHLDPEQVKNLVDECFERLVADIEEFGGRVDKIIGDAVVALFGAPTAHEDDAERAVRAGLRMQESLRTNRDIAAINQRLGRELQMRIGVNTGEVLVGALRAGGDYTAMGDVVNTANRLQSAAQPGSVVVGAATHAATQDSIEYHELGLLDARGRDEAVAAWQALGAVGAPGQRRRRVRAPLVGRDGEIAIMRQAIGTAIRNRRAQMVLLLGESGMGKTRLAREVTNVITRQLDAHIMSGRCVPYGEANPWWPVAEALRADLGLETQADLEQACAAIEDVWARHDQPGSPPPVEGLLAVLGYQTDEALDPERALEQEIGAVVTYVRLRSVREPVILVLADLQWADRAVLALIDRLLEALGRERFAVVGTTRPGGVDEWTPAPGRHNTVILHLDAIEVEWMRRLLHVLAGPDVIPDVADMILERAGGNPFYLEELVALLQDASGGCVETLGMADAEQILQNVPHSLRGLAAARIDALSETERSVLSDAAVLGRSGEVDDLALMSDVRGVSGFTEALAGLEAKEIIRVDTNRWRFRSEVVRDVAYETLTKSDRAIRHAKVAMWLESHAPEAPPDSWLDGLAHHYGRAAELVAEIGRVGDLPDDLDQRAVHWLLVAGDRAIGREINMVAVRRYTTALRLEKTDRPRRRRILLGRAMARGHVGETDAARVDAERALQSAQDDGDATVAAEARTTLGQIAQWDADYETAIAHFDQAHAEWTALGDDLSAANALRARGLSLLLSGDLERALDAVCAAHDVYVELGDRRGVAWAQQHRAWIAYIEGRIDEADERLHESIDAFAELDDLPGMAWSLGLLAWVRFYQGDLAEADALSQRIVEEATAYGDRWANAMMVVLRATVRLWTGAVDEAIEAARDARRRFEHIDDSVGVLQASAPLGRALVAAGQVDEGFEVLEAQLELAGLFPGSLSGVAPTSAASAAVHIGDPARALRYVQNGAGELEPMVIGQGDRLVAVCLARVMQGDGTARADLQSAYELAKGTGIASYAAASLALALAAGGDPEGALRLGEEVRAADRATYLDRLTAALARALAQASLGKPEAIDTAKDARLAADTTGDRVMHAVTRMAEAEVLRSLGREDESVALSAEVDRRLARLGISGGGWLRLFRLALGEVADVTATSA